MDGRSVVRKLAEQDTTGTKKIWENHANARCDAAFSAWDPWLAQMYLETLYALSRQHLN